VGLVRDDRHRPGSDRLRLDGDEDLAACGDEVLEAHALRDRQPPAFDEVERLVDLDAPGAGLPRGQVAGRKALPRAVETEGAVPAVTLFRTPGRRRVPLRERRQSALLAEKHMSN
jgi:hypothetical protein